MKQIQEIPKTYFISKIEKVNRVYYQEVSAIDETSAIINAKESGNWKHQNIIESQSSSIHVELVGEEN